MKKTLPILLVCITLGQNLSAQGEAAGYLRFNTEPSEDIAAWEDSARFRDVPLLVEIAYRGLVGSTSGSEIAVDDFPIWTLDAFASTHFVEIVSGAAAGARFVISANTANSLNVDLDGGSLSGIAANDEIIVAPFWTLNALFPEGLNLTTETEILFAPNFSTRFVYRGDLGRWVDATNTGTDVGEDLIPHDAQLVIRQSASAPIKPFIWGFHSPTPALQATINYLQIGNNDLANGIDLTAASGSLGIDTSGADGETNEPQHGGNTSTASVWFHYTATQDGSLIVSSENSAFDTLLAAYSGSAVGSLTLLGANDDSATGSWSELTIPVSAGQTYRLALDGKEGESGTAYLSWAFSESVDFPEISVEQPIGNGLTSGSATIDFGSVEVGSSAQRTFTISNTGAGDLTGLTTTWVGNSAGKFVASAFGSTTVAPESNTTLTVTFSPTANGVQTGTLRIASNDSDENPFEIDVTANGATPEIAIENQGASLIDGTSALNFDLANPVISLTIRNSGDSNLSGIAVSIDGTDASDFSAGSVGANTLLPGESTTVEITFSSEAMGPKSAALHIASNDADENPFDLVLSGEGAQTITLESWGTNYGLSGDALLFSADDDGDLLTLLEEYAYNLDPTAADNSLLQPGAGTAGKPLIRLVGDRLQIEFLRRRNGVDLEYTAQFGSSLSNELPSATESETVTVIDDDFERVIVNDSQTTLTANRRFGRVSIEVLNP